MSLAPLLLAAALIAAPAGPVPSVIAPGCDVSDATLSWGFKESFRAYIASDIANGSWETADGATYETPDFHWTGGTGRYNPADGTGYIQFTGSVHFTGHDGLLDTTITDPFVRFDGGSGELLLDVSGPTMDGEPFSQDDVEFVAMPVLNVEGDDAVRTADAATALTADGAVAFPNYAEGEAFDPVALSLTVGKQCAGEVATGDLIEPQPAGGPPVPLLIIAGALVAAAAIVLVFFLTRRRRA